MKHLNAFFNYATKMRLKSHENELLIFIFQALFLSVN